MRIVFFGTPEFAKTILEYLVKKNVEIAAVITRPDKPKGRSGSPQPSPVKQFALQHDLDLYQPEKASDVQFSEFLRSLKADLFIVAAYAEILKENVLNIPPYGCINVHASILPKYRGAAPIHRTVMIGEKETGVTIMKMAKELDAGEIFAISKISIPEDMTTGELTEALADLGAEALWDVVQKLENGKIQAIPQDPSQATYAKKVRSEDGFVDWKNDCDAIYNQIRGVTPKPGAWCWIWIGDKKRRMLIKKSTKKPGITGQPGELISDANELIVSCSKGAISLLEIQVEGKKTTTAAEFLRGVNKANLKF